jgi:hypothetical protein
VTLSLQESQNDNGVAIDAYELWMDAGDDTLSSFSQVSTYTQYSATHTLTVVDDGLGSVGTIYRVKFRARNSLGVYSDFSSELIFALGALPSTTNAPYKSIVDSSEDSIMVVWDPVSGDDLPILGYRLYADTGQKDDLVLVYDGMNLAITTQFLFDSSSIGGVELSNQLFYRFQVTAINFNGESERSPISLLQTCTTPGQVPEVTIVSVSSSFVGIEWQAPTNTGGCPITSYHLYLD